MVDFDVGGAVFGDGLWLGEPDRANLGVREDDGGDVLVGQVGLREIGGAEESVGEVSTGGDGDWNCQNSNGRVL